MSKELKSVSAFIEIPDTTTKTSNYLDTEVLLTSFSGGKDRGHSLQITFEDEEDTYKHFQLPNKEVLNLIKILRETYEN